MKRKTNQFESTNNNGFESVTQFTLNHVNMFISVVRTTVNGMIGLTLTSLFFIVVVTLVGVALFGEQSQGIQLLNTALSIIGSALGAVLTYYLARETKRSANN